MRFKFLLLTSSTATTSRLHATSRWRHQGMPVLRASCSTSPNQVSHVVSCRFSDHVVSARSQFRPPGHGFCEPQPPSPLVLSHPAHTLVLSVSYYSHTTLVPSHPGLAPETVQVNVDGPYGEHLDPTDFDTILLVAGGIGRCKPPPPAHNPEL